MLILVTMGEECFSYDDLIAGFIRYNQADHKGVEPTADRGTLQASDGKHFSATLPLKIKIVPTNDEVPDFTVGNTTCKESCLCDIGSLISLSDADIPVDRMTLKFSTPKHGILINKRLIDTMERLIQPYTATVEEVSHICLTFWTLTS